MDRFKSPRKISVPIPTPFPPGRFYLLRKPYFSAPHIYGPRKIILALRNKTRYIERRFTGNPARDLLLVMTPREKINHHLDDIKLQGHKLLMNGDESEAANEIYDSVVAIQRELQQMRDPASTIEIAALSTKKAWWAEGFIVGIIATAMIIGGYLLAASAYHGL